MFKSSPQPIARAFLRFMIVLGLLCLPFAAVAAPTQAGQVSTAPDLQAGKPPDNVEIVRQVQNPDGTTSVTVRIYATPSEANAPDTNFWLSQDTYIASGNPNGNYASATNLAIGYNSSGPQAMRLLMQFNLSSIPSNATVNSAYVYIYQYASAPSNDSPMGFEAQYAVSPWNEWNATWNNANYIGGTTLPVGYFPNTLGWLSVNATNLFRSWVNGTYPNYGLIITGDESPSNNRSRYFYSSNASSNRPYVDINYSVGCSYTVAPTSWVNGLPGTSPNAFTVSWTGQAYTPPGCAANSISSYIVWYQVNHGGFIKWLDGVSYTSATFNAASLGIGNGSVVGFRSQAIDIYGNKTPAGDATAQTTIQSVDPGASMTSLPTWKNSSNFTVSWTGFTNGGPAITGYNLDVSINGGGWQRLENHTPLTSYQYQGAQNGSNYNFRVQASNNGGVTFGAWSSPTGTTIDTTPPTASITPLPEYTPSTSFRVYWSGSDAASGIAYYNVQYQINAGTWQTLISNTPQTSFYVQNGQTGQLWGFRVQAVDNAGNQQAWSSTAQAQTTVFANPVAIVLPFNPPILQSSLPITFPVQWIAVSPPGTNLTSVTVLYRMNYSPTWTLWQTFPAPQSNAIFTATVDGVYQFQATAADDALEPPLELPQYAQTVIVDSAGVYQVRAYLPLIFNNGQ